MGDGRQASHWRDNDLSGTLMGMMDPTLDTGQTFEITYADKWALDLIGYDIDLTGSTAMIDNVTENATYGARVTGIASIGITFDEAVSGFDISDILLLRDSQQVSLSGATLVNSGDDIHFTLQNLVEETSYIGGQGVLWGLHDYELRLVADGSGVTDMWGNALADDASETWASRIRRGDLSGDGVLNVEDINPFVLALTNISGYQAAYPDIWGSHVGDYDGNDTINTEDMNPFVADLYSTGDNQNPGESLMGSGSGLSGSEIASYIMRMAVAVTAGQVDILSLVKSEQPFDTSLIDGAEVAGEGELTAVDILAA